VASTESDATHRLRATPALVKAAASIFSCPQCGSVLYVPAAKVAPTACPVCANERWSKPHVPNTGLGPFLPLETRS